MKTIFSRQLKSTGRNNMVWVAVDKDGCECIYQFRPVKKEVDYVPKYEYSYWMELPKGSIKKLIGRELTFEDKPVELKEE